MDFSKIKNNKAIQIGLIIIVPTVIVAGYFGYKFVKRKIDERKESQFVLDMREKYKNINNVDDFIEGIKYVKQPIQYGYDLKLFQNLKEKLNDFDFEEIKDIYELIKKPLNERNEEENQKVLIFLSNITE
jgi:hypothetical protein